ncbi:MAG: ATP-binding cassette domain-containing protein [Planctomycetes bacterium]|nr:ATP-binding cassette domain-containing protein [Planctomycetota bacterium]
MISRPPSAAGAAIWDAALDPGRGARSSKEELVVAIRIAGVTKRFGTHVAVNDLSLSVPEGAVYGFIGPNGSGKTTTLRMILNILVPDQGEIEVLGRRDLRAAKDEIGYLPEERSLYKKMKVRQALRYFGALKGLKRRELDPRIDPWLERFDLVKWADKKIETLSKGMSQKVQFIATIVSDPKLVILDEPFSGLDPVNADILRDAVLELHRRGSTVVFSTHDMEMAEKLCDVIFMIFRGNKVLDAPLDAIQRQYGEDTVRLRLGSGAPPLEGLPGVRAVRDYGNYKEVRYDGDPQVLLQQVSARANVQLFEIARPSLHDIFVRIAGPEAAEVKRV